MLTAVNAALVPVAKPGASQRLITSTTDQPYPDGGGIGALRTVCDYSHFNFDDALVYPGQKDRSHLHMYFGNTTTDANTNPDTIANAGNSSCRGGIVNRSGYWIAAMIDTRSGQPLVPVNQDVAHGGIDVYYKTGYHGVRDADVRAIPKGFRMIAGNSKSTGAQSSVPQIVEYGCNDSNWQSFIPSTSSCGPGNWVYMSVQFPQCWDGSSLDSPDHKSHVQYATDGRGCVNPAFPVALPEVTYVVKYRVGPEGTASWRLSSDVIGAPAGSSGHADYVFGWDETVFGTAIREIVNRGLSGGSNLVGGGQSIYY